MTRRRAWFRVLCWAIAYLIYFDTLAMSVLRYGESRAARLADSLRTEAGESPSAPAGGSPSDQAAASGDVLHVSASDPTCGGSSPCFATIQAAIDAVGPGERVLVRAGQYDEPLRILGKNLQPGASEADRIVIEADPDAAVGAVVIGGGNRRCARGRAVEIDASRFVTFRGFVLRDAGGQGIVLRGRGRSNQAIHLERNRIFASGNRACSGGISILRGNAATVVANNLIYANGRQGIYVADQTGGPQYLVSNTVVGNGWDGVYVARGQAVHLLNNLIAGNGQDRQRRGARYGVRRRGTDADPSAVRLEGNLICGHPLAELKGRLLDDADADNLTPTGSEGPGVGASPGCGAPGSLFADRAGEDGQLGTIDDDFRLAVGSAALDAGVALVERLPEVAAAILRADHSRADVRPADGDGDDAADYDIGAVEEGAGAAPTATPTPPPTATPTPTLTASPSPTPTATPTPTPTPTVVPNRPPTITSTPVTRVVVSVPEIDPPEPDFDFIELTPPQVGSTQNDRFSTLPTTDPTVFGFTGSDLRKVNFDTAPSGSPLASGTQLTDEYASLGVLMSNIPISSGVYGGPASPPNATFIGPIGGQQAFTFTVPVVAVGIINTSPDQDRIAFYSPTGELMFTIRDQDAQPGPNFNVDRFVGARVTDSNLIGSIVFQNEAGNDEFDELIFEVSTAQLPRADYVYDVDATDPDLDTLTYSLVEGPVGMQIDPGTGLVTWTPTSLDVGVHSVKVRVEDGRGGFDEQSYDLEVVEQAKIPNVIGQTQAAASATIAAAGFTVGNVTTQYHPTPAGQVFGQSPLGGTSAPAGTAVDLVVSLGPEPIPTPTPSPAPTETPAPTPSPTLEPSPTPTLTPTPPPPGAPVANDDSFELEAGQVMDVPASGVLGNDTDPNFDPLSAMLVQGPASGELDLRADGSFTYDPLGSRGKAFVYCEDFQDDQKPIPEWSPATRDITPPPPQRRFLGRFGNQTVSLSLADLPPHEQITVAFNLFAIGSWDGNDGSNGPDQWSLAEQGGAALLTTTFANLDGGRQAYPGAFPGGDNAARTGASESNSLRYPADAVYAISRTFDHSGASLALDFSASGLSALADESWGIDNVCVSIGAPLEAQVELRKDYFFARPESFQSMMAPAVADLDGDGFPEVVFSTFTGGDYGGNGILRAQSMASTYETDIDLAHEAAAIVTTSPISANEISYGRGRAFDGDENTTWYTNFNGQPVVFDIELRGDSTVRGIHMVGDRPFNDALVNDFLSGTFTLLSADGTVLHDTGVVDFPAPDREVTLAFPDVAGVRKVRFSSSAIDGGVPGFVEYQVFGDGPTAGFEMFAVTDAVHEVSPGAQVAIGDIDLDGRPEIVAVSESRDRLIAFEGDGTFKWLSDVVPGGDLLYAAPSLADLDQDGTPEIVVGATALNADGTVRWFGGDVGGLGRADGFGYTAYSTIADIDLDGSPEVVAGKSAYRADGALYWNANIADGYPAVANLDDDPEAEIVVVNNSSIWILEHDGTVKVGPVSGEATGRGPPTIADLDGDGRPEIGTEGGRYGVFESDLTLKWSQPTSDSSLVTGSSVFDFDGDGTAEVVYGDQTFLRIYRGATGEVLQAVESSNATLYELPVVVDADGDGQAEIITSNNTTFGGTQQGFSVIGSRDGSWVSTRKIWNQHTYHVTNVNEDGSIPRVERPNWLVPGLNDFRRNAFSPDDQDRTESFTYKANDGGFDSNVATVTLRVGPENGPPEIVSSPNTNASLGSPYVHTVVATDPDVGDELLFSLPQKPDGMAIDPTSGQITWEPEALGAFDVTVRVQDRRGLTDSQSFTVLVAAATPTPTASPTPSPTATATATPPGPTPTPSPLPTATPRDDLTEIVVEPVDPIILAGDSQAFTATGVFGDGTSADLTGAVAWSSSDEGIAAITMAGVADGLSAGTTTIAATLGPISGSTTLTVAAQAPGDTTTPTAEITSPAANSEVTSAVDVIGTATDANFLKYELEVAPVGETTFTLLERGGAPVSNGTLGRLDPTLLLNGPYTVRLTVFDRGGNSAAASVVYVIAREKKVGLFTVAFTDLNVELAGIPITLTRTYDSRDKGKGDFGIGWRLAVQTLRLRTNRVLGTGWTTQNSGISVQLVALDQHYVTVTLPDGKVETFDLLLSPTSQPFSLDATNVVGFAPRPGTLGTLEGLDNGSLLVVQGGDEVELWDDLTFQTYNPRRFRYTTATGQKIVIDRLNGVESVTDSNGNALTIGTLGITHSSGKSVTFLRDGEGRITEITDPAGATQEYAYDAAGDLISHTSPVGNTTTFKYNRFHGLLDIFDPTGARVARNEYDENGRLIATTDGQGHRTELDHDIGGSQELIRDRLGHETIYTYDAVGNVMSKTDAMGGLTTYTHDGRGNLLTETDPLGRVSTKTYDATNNVLTSTDFDGNTTTKTYNARGQVLTTTDHEGRTTTNVYDAQGNLTQTTDPEGGVTTYTHDPQGNVVTKTDPISRTTTFTYNSFGHKASETDALGHVTTFSPNANGNVLTETHPGGQVAHFQYDTAQRLIGTGDGGSHQGFTTYSIAGDGRKVASLENPGGETRSFEYNARGDLIETTHADGSTSTSTYDPEGRETSRTDRDGHTTLYEYDALGRQTKIIHPDGGTIVKTYDAVGRLLTQRDERGNTTTYTYAPNQQTVTDALGNATVHEFDGRAQRIRMTDALGRVTTFAYDSRDNLVETRFPDGTTKTASYDLAGQKIAETDQAGETTTFTYDDAGNLESVTNAAGETTSYAYDARGNRTSETDGNGHTTVLEYDLLDRLIKRTRPLGQFETFTYDLNGNIATHTDFEGQTTSFGYDGDARQTGKTLPDSTVVPYAYSNEGLRTQAGGDSYEYDSRGRLMKETKASGEVLSYGYDTAGNRTSLTTPQGTTTYTYDALNRLETVVDATGTVTYAYDHVGNLAETAYPNGVTTTYEYDDLNRLEKMTNTGPGGLISSYTYTLGAAGNRLGVVEFGPATTGRVVTYDYDAVYRLVQETIDEPGTANDQVIVYTYDSVGNRTETDRGGVTTTLLYDDNDRLMSETTGAVVTSYSYSDNGNLEMRTTGATTDTYGYDAENRLIDAILQSGPNPGIVEYDYDADGMRTSATANGATTSFLLDKNREHAQVLVETKGVDVVVYTYGHDLISQTRPGTGTRFYQYDGQLSTRQLTNTAGTATDTYAFDAFGVLLASTGSSPNAYLYGGEQLDPNVGFYYLRARYYNQATGRFLTTDPEEGSVFDPVSLHRYLYANADPVNNSDPSGRLTIPEIAIVSILVGTIAGIVTFAVTKSLGFAIFVGATVAASTFLVLYFFGGLTLAAGGEGFALREGIQEAVRSGTIIRTVRTGGRVLGCALLLVVRALLKLPAEELFLTGGLGLPPGTPPEAIHEVRRNLQMARRELDRQFGRVGIGCPRAIRYL